MKIRLTPWTTVFCLASLATFLTFEAKTMDPYKVLGVEPNASQREIQKAFHKLSLQYHPDKNKSKGAQQKFAEINNAYEILSDEEKRRNYDTYGDEKGNPGFGTGGYSGDQSGYTYFTSGGPGQNQYGSKSGQWQDMGGQGGSKSFSFSFGGPRGSSSFGSGLEDIFSNIFGGHVNSGGGQFGGFGPFGGSSGSQSGSRSSPKNLKSINSQVFMKDIADQGITWILMSYSPSLRGIQRTESVIEEVASSLQGAVKVGAIDCESELSFCKDLGVYPNKAPRVVIYSYKTSDLGSLVDYSGDLVAKNLKSFCQEHLPRFSKRVDLKKFEFSSNIGGRLPSVMLLSSKKDTPVIWRVLSGLYRKRFVFLDAEVNDVSDPIVKKLRVDAVPAIIGWLPDGEKHVLRTGINVKDLKTTIKDLSTLLDGFEKKNKAASSKTKKAPSHSEESHIPLLTASNFDDLCGESTPVCIIGAFKSRKAKEKLQSILSIVSHKTLSRRQILSPGSKDALSYTLLDASKHTSFLNAYDKASFKSSDKILIAYKPRKGKFAVFKGEIGAEEVERFIGSVLNGDIQFMKTRQKPEFR